MRNSIDKYQTPNPERVVLDLFPIRVGQGGTGSGVWTYARELLHAMDQQIPESMELICFVNEGQLPYLSKLQNICLIPFAGGLKKGLLSRLGWIHLRLPMACRKHGVNVLHKLATDNPWFCPAQRVTTIHDFYYDYLLEQKPRKNIRLYERLENLYFAWVSRICFRKSSAIIAVSAATREEAVRRYPSSADRLTVIHHGAPNVGGQRSEIRNLGTTISVRFSDGGTAASPTGINSEASSELTTTNTDQSSNDAESSVFSILCVAKFMEHKGQHLLIDAFERLMDSHPELDGKVRLRLRGFHNDADYFERIRRKILGSRNEYMIRLEAFNAGDALTDIYQDTDLVVLLSSYEGFGLPVLEAQGMGIPVLCSDLRVLREVGGSGAVYVNRKDSRQVAEALYRFVADPDWRIEQRERALMNLRHFSWKEAARRTLDVYLKVAACK